MANFTLEKSMKTQKGSRSTHLLFLWLRRYMRFGVKRQAPAAVAPVKKPSTHRKEECMAPKAVQDGCGKTRPRQDSIPGPSST